MAGCRQRCAGAVDGRGFVSGWGTPLSLVGHHQLQTALCRLSCLASRSANNPGAVGGGSHGNRSWFDNGGPPQKPQTPVGWVKPPPLRPILPRRGFCPHGQTTGPEPARQWPLQPDGLVAHVRLRRFESVGPRAQPPVMLAEATRKNPGRRWPCCCPLTPLAIGPHLPLSTPG